MEMPRSRSFDFTPRVCTLFRAMEQSSSSLLGDAPILQHAPKQQEQRNFRTNGPANDSIAAGTKPKKGSFGGPGSAFQNSSSQSRISLPTVPIQLGSLGVSGTPSCVPNSLCNDFPELSNLGKAPISTPPKVIAKLYGEQQGNYLQLESVASPVSVEGTSAREQNTTSQMTPKPPSQQKQWGSRQPPLGPGEQGQTRLPREHQELKQAGEVDGPTSVQTGPERERQRNFKQNRQSTHHDKLIIGHRKGAELRNEQEMGILRDGRQNSQGRNPTREKAEPIDTLGRALTRILRHQAVELNLDVGSDGYVDVQDLLKLSMKTASNRSLTSHSIADVKQAVQQDKKQRFGIKDENGRLFIRANQGHTMESVKSEHLLKTIVSADEVPVCVHGTYRRHLGLIFKEGLKRMQRNHVHFASGVPGSGDVISGMRNTCEVLIYLNVNKALADGMKLYVSENKVILTNGFEGVVPAEYFKEVLGLPDMKPIARPSGPA